MLEWKRTLVGFDLDIIDAAVGEFISKYTGDRKMYLGEIRSICQRKADERRAARDNHNRHYCARCEPNNGFIAIVCIEGSYPGVRYMKRCTHYEPQPRRPLVAMVNGQKVATFGMDEDYVEREAGERG